MSNSFLHELHTQTSIKHTENGAVAYETSLNRVLDLFALGGAYRSRSDEDVMNLFLQAYSEDKKLALRALFYLRDIRGGQGERRFFRTILPFLFKEWGVSQRYVVCNLIEKYGRLDDLLCVYSYPEVYGWIHDKLYQDLVLMSKGEPVSLLAKWLPSINTSSQKSVKLARQIATDLAWTEKTYRKNLSALRKHIDIVERRMSSNDWENINYETVPSQAMLKYRNAFSRQDAKRFVNYLEDVKTGKSEIKTGTLYPYQIIEKALNGEDSDVLESLWGNLPDYVSREEKAIVVADVSGSMMMYIEPRPMYVALSLALYFAERNVGDFANKFITFSEKPKLQHIPTEGTLPQRVWSMITNDWGSNTDIDAVFQLLLDTAKRGNVRREDMPTTLYIVSDMQFDQCALNADVSNYEAAKQAWNEAGYELPVVVFWNVAARNDTLPVREGEAGTVLVSGASPSIFKQVVEKVTPLEFMLQVLRSDRYDDVDALGVDGGKE